MTATLLYRIAAVVLVVFAAGHTFGFITFRPPGAEGLAVHQAMNSVQFEFDGAKHSYGAFYTGFGITVTAYMLFSAFLAWHLGGLAARQPGAIGALGWVFAALQLVCVALNIVYFFLVPVLFSAVVAVCLLWAAWLVGHAGAA